MVFLGREIAMEKNYSEKVAAEIDREVRKFLHQALSTAKRVVDEKRMFVKRVARRLLEVETIERDEFEKLVGKIARRAPAGEGLLPKPA
jgi:cell division protease FtsH